MDAIFESKIKAQIPLMQIVLNISNPTLFLKYKQENLTEN